MYWGLKRGLRLILILELLGMYLFWCFYSTFHFYLDLLWPNCVLKNNLIQLDINILRITFLTTIEVHTTMSESRLKYLERNYTIYVVKGGFISEIDFQFGPVFKQMNEITYLWTYIEKNHSKFIQFFEKRTKLKIPSEIKPPVQSMVEIGLLHVKYVTWVLQQN